MKLILAGWLFLLAASVAFVALAPMQLPGWALVLGSIGCFALDLTRSLRRLHAATARLERNEPLPSVFRDNVAWFASGFTSIDSRYWPPTTTATTPPTRNLRAESKATVRFGRPPTYTVPPIGWSFTPWRGRRAEVVH